MTETTNNKIPENFWDEVNRLKASVSRRAIDKLGFIRTILNDTPINYNLILIGRKFFVDLSQVFLP